MPTEPSPAQTTPPATAPAPPGAGRPLGRALRRGWRRRCPRCGTGPVFSGYLRVQRECPDCAEALHHQRADDGPAYLTILLVGHLTAPVLHVAFLFAEPDPLLLAGGLCLGAGTLSLWLLPRFKGAFVALQWARRMHGFGAAAPGAGG